MGDIPQISTKRRLPIGARTCPNAGESYQVDRIGEVSRTKDEHPIETEQDVVIDDGGVALRISASCECGWSDTEVISS